MYPSNLKYTLKPTFITTVRKMALSISKLSILAILFLATWGSASRQLPKPSMMERHERWMLEYGRTYEGEEEKAARFAIFKKNVEFIEAFNAEGTRPYKVGINAFADQTNEEFTAARNGLRVPEVCEATPFRYGNATALPSTMDWRKEGAVTPVKDQGQCGKSHSPSSIYLGILVLKIIRQILVFTINFENGLKHITNHKIVCQFSTIDHSSNPTSI